MSPPTLHKTAKLGTALSFKVHNLQGQNGFPVGSKGLVYEYLEQRVIRCKHTGIKIRRDARYVIRTDSTDKGWRIDLLPKLGPAETVYGLDAGRSTYWSTPEQAAQAFSGVLDEIANNTSI